MASTTTSTHLENFSDVDFTELAKTSSDLCISIFMPTHRAGRETEQDPIRFKNAIRSVREQLERDDRDVAILDSLEAKLGDDKFWQHQGDGLAIFITPEQTRFIRLSRDVEERVHVGRRFMLTPLLAEHNSHGRYFVLALCWDNARLFQRDGDSLEVVETTNLPGEFHDLILPRDPEEALQNTSHRPMGTTGGTSVAMYHGQGEGEDKIEADRIHYLKIVGQDVSGAIYNKSLPLVIVATPEVRGHFETATSLSADVSVDGSPADMDNQAIQQSAHQAVVPHLRSSLESLAERFGKLHAEGLASTDVDEIITAAQQGRVDTLVLCDTTNEKLNEALIATLENGGDAKYCEVDCMPCEGETSAALFRF